MADVTVRMTAENAELVRAWMEAKRGPEAFGQELDKIGQKGQRAGRATKAAMGEAGNSATMAGAQVGKFVSAFTGIGSVVGGLVTIGQLLRQEWEAANAHAKASGVAQVSFGRQVALTQDVFLNNTGNFTLAELAKSARQDTSGVSPEDLVQAFREASGEAGDYDLSKIWDLTKMSGRMAPAMDVDSRTSLVRAALTNAKEFGVSPEEAMAGSITTFAASNAKDVKAFADNVAPTIKSLHQLGGGKDSYEDLAAHVLTFNQMAGDETGQRGRTGQQTFATQIMEETLKAGLVKQGAGFIESLEAAQKSPEIQRKLLGVFAPDGIDKMAASVSKDKKAGVKLEGEKAQFAAAREALTGGEEYQRQLAAMKAKRPSLDQNAVNEVEARQRELGGIPEFQTLKVNRLKESLDNLDKLSNSGGTREEILGFNNKIREAAGMGWSDRGIADQQQRWGNWWDPEENALTLERSEEDARKKAALLRKQGTLESVPGRGPTPEGNMRADNLEAIANEIRGLREDIQTKTLKVKSDNRNPADPGPQVPPIRDR